MDWKHAPPPRPPRPDPVQCRSGDRQKHPRSLPNPGGGAGRVLAWAQELTPVERHGIHEIQGNHWELSGDPEHIAAYYDVVLSWACGDLDRRMPGGELGHDFFARYDAVVEEAVRSARSAGLGTVALVSHGTAIRCWTSRRTDNLAAAELEQRPLENTGVVVLEESADGERPWTCRSWMGEPVGGVGAGAHSGPAGGSIF